MSRLHSWPVGEDRPAKGAAAARAKHLPPDLLRRWDAALADAGAPPAVRENRERLVRPDCRVVVTGQQPGAWGGPLFSAYKAATAIALARRLAADGGGPAVPVFWVQGDDTDWDEVGWGTLPDPGLGLVRHRWHPAPVPARHWVGSAVLEPVPEMTAVFEAWNVAPDTFALDPSPSRDLARGFTAFLLGVFGEAGLVPLDSRWPEVRAAGAGLWDAYVPRHGELARAVMEAGKGAAGDAPLDAAAADHGLFILDGEHRLPVDPEVWEAQAGEALASGRPQDLAPSVLLRAVLQDHLLGSAAHVVGRAEGAYLRQLAPVYAALGVEPPRRVQRLHGTVVPAGMIPADDLNAALDDPEAWIGTRAASRIPASAREALKTLGRETASRLDAFAADGDTELSQLAASARRKIEGQLARLDDALDRQARRALYREHPRFRNLGEFLHPRRGPQERGLSAAALAFFFGEAAAAVILEAADSHLERLEAGTVHHFVMEAGRG